MKDYNSDMGSIDLIDKKTAAYKLGYKSERRFHLWLFFDLMDMCMVNSHIVYEGYHAEEMELLDF